MIKNVTKAVSFFIILLAIYLIAICLYDKNWLGTLGYVIVIVAETKVLFGTKEIDVMKETIEIQKRTIEFYKRNNNGVEK